MSWKKEVRRLRAEVVRCDGLQDCALSSGRILSEPCAQDMSDGSYRAQHRQLHCVSHGRSKSLGALDADRNTMQRCNSPLPNESSKEQARHVHCCSPPTPAHHLHTIIPIILVQIRKLLTQTLDNTKQGNGIAILLPPSSSYLQPIRHAKEPEDGEESQLERLDLRVLLLFVLFRIIRIA